MGQYEEFKGKTFDFNDSEGNGNGNGERRKKDPEKLIELASENSKLFKDQYMQGHALVKINDHYESMQLNSKRFSWYLSKLFYDKNSNIPTNIESVNNAINILGSKANFESPTIPLFIRVAWSQDKKSIYYDLTNETWDYVRIDRSGVELKSNTDFPPFWKKKR